MSFVSHRSGGGATVAAVLLFLTVPGVFAATLTFGTSAPTPTDSSISNVVGAAYDADNVGGSGVNANGGSNNGAANDATTYVAGNQPVQGQTFTTGPNEGGYTLGAITMRMQGYTSNTASGANIGNYDLNDTTTFRLRVGRPSGTTFIPYTIEYATSGGTGNPGQGGTANGPGTYLTFTFKAPIILNPNTVYAFDIGTTGNYFEVLGTRADPYAGGTAYTSGANGLGGGTITTQSGERVFQIDMTAYTPPAAGVFAHPGLLNTDVDFERMRTNVALGQEPWLSGYNALNSSWMAQSGGWGPHAQATITRGATNDTVRLYQDMAVAYASALRWKISGDTAYADQAVTILNAWGYTFTSLAGDTNIALCELYGYQCAAAAEIMRSYPGWAPADIAQFKTMIYNVFYPLANNFLGGHFGTAYDHYWANWDLASLNTIYAIGVFCDNPALTTQAINYFKSGVGNGCIDRTVNFIHPGYLGQGQEMGRDQGHASLDIAELATLCQMAWNQGTDLFGYENNRVLSMAEYTARYNLWQDVPWTNYAYGSWLMTGPSGGSRGATGRPGWATFYNHYVNIKGLAAPYTKTVVDLNGPYWSYNGDSPGWDYLTTALPPIATGANPSSLTALPNGQKPLLSWWGSAYATSYNIKRSTTSGGSYATIAAGVTTNTYTDTSAVSGTTYYYVVTGSLSGGGITGNSNEAQVNLGTSVYAQLSFDAASGTTAADATGNGWTGTLVNGASWTSGKINNAVNLAKASSQYVSLPSGVVAGLSDFSISAWIYQNSASAQGRIFDFGDGDGMYGGVDVWGNTHWFAERYMYLTTQSGSGKLRFGISHSAGAGEQGVEGSAVATGQWVHVTVTKSGSVATLYVNGQAVGQNLNMPMSPMQFPPTTQNYIGKSQWRGDSYFDGKIDDFRIYRGALSTGQAYTLATSLAPATPPPAPTGLTVTALVGNQNSLSWTASAGATSYTVSRATTPGGPYTIIATLVSGTTYIDTALVAGTTYYYVVDGANTGGDGSVSSQSSATALPPLPSVPTGFSAFVASSSSAITLDWADAANASSYTVKRSLTDGGPYITLASGVTASTYTDTGLTEGATYYYVVSSVNTAGESANSAQDSAAPSDLLLHLRFDEASGATTADSSGNGWDATLVNAPTWTAGRLGNAALFTAASSQSATLSADIVSGVHDFTISTWVKMTSFGTFSRIFDFGTGTTNYMFLTPQYTATAPNAAKPRFAIRTSAAAEQQLTSSAAIPANTWTHIAVTLTGSTGRMYLNGTLVATNAGMSLNPASLGNTTLKYFGRSQFAADPYLDGSLDDFHIFSRALSAAEIAAQVNPPPTIPAGLTGLMGDGQTSLNWAVDETAGTYTVKRSTVSGGPYTAVAGGSGLTIPAFTDTGLTNGTTYYYVVSAVNWLGESANSAEVAVTPSYLRVHLRFDESNGTGGADSTGHGWNATTVNAPVFETGNSGNALKLASASSQYAALPAGIVNGLTNTTIMTWIRISSLATWQRIFDFGTGTTNNLFLTTQYGVGGTANKLRFGIRTPGVGEQLINSSATTPAGTWVHVAVVISGTTGRLYLNGAEVGVNTGMTLTPSSLGSTTRNYLGKSQWSDPYLDASLDDFRIYSRAMNAGEISLFASPLDAPENLAASADYQQVQLEWEAVPNATSYTVKSSTSPGGLYTPVASGLTSPTYTHTGLSPGVTRYYVVGAENMTGQGPNSAEVGATPDSPPITEGEIYASRLDFSSLPGNSADLTMTIATSVIGHTYRIQHSSDLSDSSWENIGDMHPGTGAELRIDLPLVVAAKRGFYRILVSR